MPKLILLHLITNLIFGYNAHGFHTHSTDHTSHSYNQPLNTATGFVLVIIGALVATLGSMIFLLDKIPALNKSKFRFTDSKPFLVCSLSFASGTLLAAIFMEILPSGIENFASSSKFDHYDRKELIPKLVFAVFVILAVVFKSYFHSDHSDIHNEKPDGFSNEKILVSDHNTNLDREHCDSHPCCDDALAKTKFTKVGYKVAIGIAIHNFPEGAITFISAQQSIKTGILFAVGLALHKFTEGLVISLPIYYGTKSMTKAFTITFLASFVTQILGALVAFIVLKYIYYDTIFNGVLLLLASAILLLTVLGDMLPLTKSFDVQDKLSTMFMCFGIVGFILVSLI